MVKYLECTEKQRDCLNTKAEEWLARADSYAGAKPAIFDAAMANYKRVSAMTDALSSAINVLSPTLALGTELPSVPALITAISIWLGASCEAVRDSRWGGVVAALTKVQNDAEEAAKGRKAEADRVAAAAESDAAVAAANRKAAEDRRAAAESDAAVAAANRKAAEDRRVAMRAIETTPGPAEAAAMAKAAANRKIAEDNKKARDAMPWWQPCQVA
ncbi:MAG: hypothetical protein LBH53_00120 [Puniceicoccales bacterium]|nr:hypothetical protein [Puniceicoccales bacterium]